MDQHAIAHFPPLLQGFDLRSMPVLRTDVLVIGGGIAGSSAALHAADAGAEVLMLTKSPFSETNTSWAQGGIAAAQRADDSLDLHILDTLKVGIGLSDRTVTRAVVAGARDALAWLQQLGANFDREGGELALSREGGHTRHRVIHAGGDCTGAEIQRALLAAVQRHPRITLRSPAFVRDLVVASGRCCGAIVDVDGAELAVEAGSAVVATGGAGQIYRETTNPTGASGDGHALCFRAGARIADCEFVQFHPTTLYIAGASRFLISEVVRGAGAVLRDRNGTAFMQGAHPMADLAPRDVTSRCILDRMVATGDTNVYLDLRQVDGDPVKRFPSIAKICSAFDLDLRTDLIPVRPGAHYMVGGAVTDLDGRTSVPGLFAAGEVASTGLHGANRLASNSLLEGAVLGKQAGIASAALARTHSSQLPRTATGAPMVENPPRLQLDDLLYSLKSLMWRQVGLRRTAEGLADAQARIAYWHHYLQRAATPDRRVLELSNMLTVAALVTEGACLRAESRGTHYRDDRPARDDATFCRRIFLQRGADGQIVAEQGPLFEPTDQQA
jgi:L-aspartate oxidase